MPPISGHRKLAEAVYTAVQEGTYSTDQDVASAELSSTALQSLSTLLEQARSDVKNSISELSRLSAADIDGWISQAKQLRQDISKSEQQSRDVVSFAAEGHGLQETAQEALAKVKFLDSEVSFNDNVVQSLKQVQEVKQTTDSTKTALQQGKLLESARLLKQAEEQTEALSRKSSSRLVHLVESRTQKVRLAIVEEADRCWSSLISVDAGSRSLSIHKSTDSTVTLDELAQVLEVLGLLQDKTSDLSTHIHETLFESLLQKPSGGSFQVEDDQTILLVEGSNSGSIETVFKDIATIQTFCKTRLPDTIHQSFVVKLNSIIVERLLTSTLSAAIPLDLSGLPAFQRVIDEVRVFAKSLDQKSHESRKKLLMWADNAPNVWLAKRSEGALHSIRQLLKRGLGRPRQVERVETQIVRHDDEVFTAAVTTDDWNADWSDEEKEPEVSVKSEPPVEPAKNGRAPQDEDEDVSGWGFDEDEIANSPTVANSESTAQIDTEAAKPTEDDEDDGAAWGWDDENESPKDTKPPVTSRLGSSQPTASPPSKPNRGVKPQDREITLRETYHISALPEQIMEIVVMAIEDADSLTRANSPNPVAAASKGLYILPGSLLSMFRASAPTFYGNDINGNMFLYNDCLYLSEKLRSYVAHHQSLESGTKSLTSLVDTDIVDLESYGKRAYGKEMVSTRTTLVDLLGGAQGFSNCTQEPFASQCDLAVSSVIDYLRQIHSQWSNVLSRSVLLQSIGSLLATIIKKTVIDIEDMSDISEPESQRLVAFCKSITSLEDLFLPDSTGMDEEQPIPLTAAYTKPWLRFQYLSNILDSSLADIKYLWTEGELSFEFTADEVVDLIEALFADSDHRRRAISEIRRSR